MKRNTSASITALAAMLTSLLCTSVSRTLSPLLVRMGVTIRRFGVCLFAMGFFFSPLSLEAAQKKSGKSKKSGTSVVKKKNPAIKSKGAQKKKNSKSKSPSNAPAGGNSSGTPAPTNPSPLTPPKITVSTIAGSGYAGFSDGNGLNASFNGPEGIAVDMNGNIFVSDSKNHRIRKITPAGDVSTLAGTGIGGYRNGSALDAQFYYPHNIALDNSKNLYIVVNVFNPSIRKLSETGTVTTLAGGGPQGFADGNGISASFWGLAGIGVDNSGNVYVTDSGNQRIRKITASGNVTTLAGAGTAGFSDGNGVGAFFSGPSGVAVDSNNNVYVADSGNHRIRKITPSGIVTTFAGGGFSGWGNGSFLDGIGTNARFNYPGGLAVDSVGNVYVSDTVNNRIRKISSSGVVSTLAGSGNTGSFDGIGELSSFNYPVGLAVDSFGNVYVSDTQNHRIRKITISQ